MSRRRGFAKPVPFDAAVLLTCILLPKLDAVDIGSWPLLAPAVANKGRPVVTTPASLLRSGSLP